VRSSSADRTAAARLTIGHDIGSQQSTSNKHGQYVECVGEKKMTLPVRKGCLKSHPKKNQKQKNMIDAGEMVQRECFSPNNVEVPKKFPYLTPTLSALTLVITLATSAAFSSCLRDPTRGTRIGLQAPNQRAMHTATRRRTRHTAHSTQHTAHSTQHTAHSTQHTAHSTRPLRRTWHTACARGRGGAKKSVRTARNFKPRYLRCNEAFSASRSARSAAQPAAVAPRVQ